MSDILANILPEIKTVTSTNIDMVAAYIAYGCKVDRDAVDRGDPRHIKFTVTGKPEDIDSAEQEMDDLNSILRRFSSALKDLKSLIHGGC